MADGTGYLYTFVAIGQTLDKENVLKIGYTTQEIRERLWNYDALNKPREETLMIVPCASPKTAETVVKKSLQGIKAMRPLGTSKEWFVLESSIAFSLCHVRLVMEKARRAGMAETTTTMAVGRCERIDKLARPIVIVFRLYLAGLIIMLISDLIEVCLT